MSTDSLTFETVDGVPRAYTGAKVDPAKEWEFYIAKHGDADLWILVAWWRPESGPPQRFIWPTTPEGEGVPLSRPPTMGELKTFAGVCLAGLNHPFPLGGVVRTDRTAEA